ncbi:hypothetical protein [Oceanispirochaeta sp.]|jgi:hypothetical protein|uniref:hypothetical protein n=1 Tax=Oceanispirochaeta sp. TaxID=2035350 RepID=UPI0026149A4B|nr:hypothetical protein [Oceanispirochaeta sp.]MDA3955656.1 hypothetical protein [Oceanispirochaeta sp.]
MELNWKENWSETQQNFRNWWNRDGFILSHWGTGLETGQSLHGIEAPPLPASEEQRHTDPAWVARNEEYRLSCNWQGADFMPMAFPDYGTVTLATFLGVEPRYEEEYILYHPTDLSPEKDRELTIDPSDRHFVNMLEISRSLMEKSAGRFCVGLPAIAPGLDVLAEIRGTQNLLMDLILNPEWVKEKLEEINRTYFECYDQFYNILKGEDGSSINGWFMFWGPGKVAQAQCDFCAMISPDMFRDFAIPTLKEHCDVLDHSLFHLDGPDAVNKLDALLEIESLDAVEFTPGPQVPQGGDPAWYDMYRKIRKAGKCVQAVSLKPEEVVPLFDEIGSDGMYLMVDFQSRKQVEDTLKQVEQFRKKGSGNS